MKLSAEAKVTINVDISGLGKGTQCKDTFVDDTAPEVALHVESMEQETADTAQVLDIGAIDTLAGVWLRAITNDIYIDTSYVSDFSGELKIKEGTSQFFCPTGITYIKNVTAAQKCIFEYVVYGAQT